MKPTIQTFSTSLCDAIIKSFDTLGSNKRATSTLVEFSERKVRRQINSSDSVEIIVKTFFPKLETNDFEKNYRAAVLELPDTMKHLKSALLSEKPYRNFYEASVNRISGQTQEKVYSDSFPYPVIVDFTIGQYIGSLVQIISKLLIQSGEFEATSSNLNLWIKSCNTDAVWKEQNFTVKPGYGVVIGCSQEALDTFDTDFEKVHVSSNFASRTFKNTKLDCSRIHGVFVPMKTKTGDVIIIYFDMTSTAGSMVFNESFSRTDSLFINLTNPGIFKFIFNEPGSIAPMTLSTVQCVITTSSFNPFKSIPVPIYDTITRPDFDPDFY